MAERERERENKKTENYYIEDGFKMVNAIKIHIAETIHFLRLTFW